jgi:hypothetical protein
MSKNFLRSPQIPKNEKWVTIRKASQPMAFPIVIRALPHIINTQNDSASLQQHA